MPELNWNVNNDHKGSYYGWWKSSKVHELSFRFFWDNFTQQMWLKRLNEGFPLRATNKETPQSSPLPSRGGDPIEILVPRDITDPLNLKGGGKEGKGEEGVLLSPLKSRKRHRNRHHGGGGSDKEMVPARLFPSTSGPGGETQPGDPSLCC